MPRRDNADELLDRTVTGRPIRRTQPAPLPAVGDVEYPHAEAAPTTVPEATEARLDARLDETVLPWTEEDERQLRQAREQRAIDAVVAEMTRAQRERDRDALAQAFQTNAVPMAAQVWQRNVAPGVFGQGMGQIRVDPHGRIVEAPAPGPVNPEWRNSPVTEPYIPEGLDAALEELSSRLTAIEKRLELIEGKGEVL